MRSPTSMSVVAKRILHFRQFHFRRQPMALESYPSTHIPGDKKNSYKETWVNVKISDVTLYAKRYMKKPELKLWATIKTLLVALHPIIEI